MGCKEMMQKLRVGISRVLSYFKVRETIAHLWSSENDPLESKHLLMQERAGSIPKAKSK